MPFGEGLGHVLLPGCYIRLHCYAKASDEILVPLTGMSVWLLSYSRAKILQSLFLGGSVSFSFLSNIRCSED